MDNTGETRRQKKVLVLSNTKDMTRSTKGVRLKFENNEKIMNNKIIATG